MVATRDVTGEFGLSESEARDWADKLGVAKIGASFAWARPDVEALAEAIAEDENLDDEQEEDAEGEQEEDSEDEDEEVDDEDE